ncbi:L-threonylcarbamoyladenylate synthase [Oribacterium sinus]|uniref:Threonylcarbamoyl-AMP synthase n=1 Tax=Oribacterium sinus TaxID=237576 RepID=A0A7W9SEF0_9FIRM|nr:L-threonylcarbamoyladenylate synthase [Oribacterium sinus]MBB6040497.1 L-threonylcarbamoyladenylate synthase [Oribacterium sinus]
MKTKIFGKEGISEAAEILKGGGLVAFPTETVYGLGGNGLDKEAAKKIYAAKGRPSDNPLILHVSSIEEVYPLVKALPEKAKKLMEAFWPGPLTLVLPKSDLVPKESTGGLETVALRSPENALTLDLIRACGFPIAGPSANLSGRPSPTEASHVFEDLGGRIEGILEDGAVGIGVESTIVDLSENCPTLLRPGAITIEDLEEVLGEKVAIDPTLLGKSMAEGFTPKAPGMKYRHYAPKAEMILFKKKEEDETRSGQEDITKFILSYGGKELSDCPEQEAKKSVAKAILSYGEKELSVSSEKRIWILCGEDTASLYEGDGRFTVQILGRREEPLSMTHNLFRLLRQADEEGAELILGECYSEEGVGFALMNRLKKAAGQRIFYV